MAPVSSNLPIFEGRGRIITHVAGWFLLFVLFFFLINTVRGPWEALARTSINLAFMMAVFYGNAKILVNRLLEKGRLQLYFAFALLLWMLLANIRAGLEMKVFGGGVLRNDQIHLKANDFSRAFFVSAISLFLVFLFSSLYQMAENRQRLVIRHLALQSEHREAQLNILKSQINPHFLFNTLNNIYAAASLQHPRTPDMVLRLSELLRYVTYETQQEKVALHKEWAQIRGYVELVQLKSEHTLPVTLLFEDQGPGREIEPILLLPLVENAFKHGDIDHNEHGFVRIELNNQADKLVFRVENTFEIEDTQKDAQGGVGLANVRARLGLHYPGKHTLTTGVIGMPQANGTELHVFIATIILNAHG